MRKPMIAGNWKMNKNRDEALQFIYNVNLEVPSKEFVDTVIASQDPVLRDLVKRQGDNLRIAAQNMHEKTEGAFTGETSADLLENLGVTYVIIGHSERRAYYNETDASVNKKLHQAFRYGLTPILCVGENLAECEAGETETVITRQVMAVIDQVGIDHFFNAVIAYEPGWANGTGQIASSEHVQYVHGLIRRLLRDRDPYIARELQLIYGGSVNPTNAIALFQQPDVNGALVGGASLDARAFIAICDALEQAHRHALAQGA